jgi:RNA-directed DNA polymerase
MHENQETSIPPADKVGRPEKAHSRNAGVHGVEGSDPAIVPMKLPNNGPKGTAEVMEGRAGTKENAIQTRTEPTQSGETVSQGLRRVRQVAHERRKERFTALFHHLTIDLLQESFYALKREAAPGVDGVRWKEYEEGLADRLIDLHGRVHRGAYRPSHRGECTYRKLTGATVR